MISPSKDSAKKKETLRKLEAKKRAEILEKKCAMKKAEARKKAEVEAKKRAERDLRRRTKDCRKCGSRFINGPFDRFQNCPDCRANSKKQNRERQAKMRRNLKEEKRALKMEAIDFLGGCCSVCGYKKNAAAFDFHHVSHKNEAVSKLIGKMDRDKLFEELELCVLMCANCHREHHNPDLII